ncbi:hypothetical protein [Legionella sp. km772]|uniref:hypothetical protein n=1 Tax=Legionella sp. km772 TaxID=2498111 RepID=UPI0013158EC9|nr:hypothetical protein [Legionella sp. km772]
MKMCFLPFFFFLICVRIKFRIFGIFINYSCYARSILSCHIFKLLPSNLVRSKNQFVLNSKVI